MGPYKIREILANIIGICILGGVLYAGLWLTP